MQDIDLLRVQGCINANLRRACRAVTSLYSAEMHESELQGTQFTLLAAITGHGECTITALADYLTMDQTTVTRSVQKLINRGWVESVPGSDRRMRIVRLTAEGEATLAAAFPLWLQVQTRIEDRLGREKTQQLLSLLDEVAEMGGLA